MKTIFIVGLLLIITNVTFSQSEEDLAKAAQNPLASMYSLPFQNNTIYGVGAYERPQNVLNIQPVIPVSISEKVNMINRIILPVITQPSSTEDKSTTGTGDISYSAWLSPTKASKIIWGVGTVMQIPTASSSEFGSGEFGIGPSLVALTMIDKWVAGIVTNNVWTFGDKEENKFVFQYFINYNFPDFYLVTAPILTANWNAPSDNRWIVPFGGGIGKVVKFGKLPVNINVQAYYNAVKPDGIGDWQSRIQVQFMFPTSSTREKMKGAN